MMARPAAKATTVRASRGHPKKSDVFGAAPVVATDPPKKRGRPSTVAAVIKEPLVELEPSPATPKKRGRPSKAAAKEAAEDAPQPTPKSRPGRPAKTAAVEKIATPPKKKLVGRPPKATTTSSLNRVAGSPRVSKRAPTKRVSTATTSAANLRTRTAPVKKDPVPVEAPKKRGRPAATKKDTTSAEAPKRRGRPATTKKDTTSTEAPKKRGRPAAAKKDTTSTEAPKKRVRPAATKDTTSVEAPKKGGRKTAAKSANKPAAGSGRGRPRKDASAPAAAKKASKTARAAISKPVAPRKRRGYTTLEVPDKFAAQLQNLLLTLQNDEVNQDEGQPTIEEAEEESAEEEQEHVFQDQDVIVDESPIDKDEDAEESAQEEVHSTVVVNPVEEKIYEEEVIAFSGDLDEPAVDGNIEIEYEVREETIIEEPTNQQLQMQEILEDRIHGAVRSELTPSINNDFEESAHETSILQRSMVDNDASRLFA
jgi:hypothetical protein